MSAEFRPDLVEAALRAAAAEHVMPLYRNLSDEQIRTKSSAADFVTDADDAAERALKAALEPLWPEALFIGEESAAETPSLLSKLNEKGAFWIVDPIDGTRNFVHGRDHFAMMAALVVDGETRWSWIYAPVWDVCVTAEAGGGAYLGGERLTGRKDRPLSEFRGELNIGSFPDDLRGRAAAGAQALGEPYDHASAAHGYLAIARGEADFAVYGKIAPWDHAPGALLVRETGGRSAFLDAAEEYAPRPWPDRPLLTVADASMWEPLRAALLGD
ncbi:MAG: inositol monophosphatase [Pseudomonadota bacterium]